MHTYLLTLLGGLGITIVLTLASLVVGLLTAILLTIGVLFGNRLLKYSIHAFLFFMRGTPLLVQIFLIYYGSGQFAWLRESFLWIGLRHPMVCAILALAMNSACYTSVLLQGAIASVPKNEVDACAAMGMSKWLAFRRVIFPRAFRIALPAYSNEVLMILKGTALVSTITLLDFMGVIQQLIATTYLPIPFYLLAGAVYLILNALITGIFKLLMRYHTASIT
ncbi:MAG TPA: ABC transporter permease subunit [Gammaproteobacteria bacterium]|jgi:His/Glu/Gln/Arg/opine family amino acid ABC transporter permease subunit|nr:ABC transporter permease subunit [Gammaproteobacteria bacterium]